MILYVVSSITTFKKNTITVTYNITKRTDMRKILLYFSDYKKDESLIEDSVLVFNEMLGDEYKIICADLNMQNPNDAMMEAEILTNQSPDLIIAEGFGCFFAHQIGAGINRICINPVLSALEVDDLQLTNSAIEQYTQLEKHQYSYNRSIDKDNSTHCWGVYSQDDIVKNRLFASVYYPNLTLLPCEVKTDEEMINNTIKPLINAIEHSSWTDCCGVSFKDFGSTIDKVDLAIFQDLESYDVPLGVKCIRDYCFSTTRLKHIDLGTVHILGEGCFSDSDLEEIKIEHVQMIPENCFAGCHRLSKIVLSEGVFSIQSGAFKGTAVKEVQLPDTIQTVASDAFPADCKIVLSFSKFTEMMNQK